MLTRLIDLYRSSALFQWSPVRQVLKSSLRVPLRGLEWAVGFSTCSQDPLPYRLSMILGLDEPETTAVLRRLSLRPGSVILDVGANVGEYSRLLAKLAPQSVILCFEPNPETYRILVQNLRHLAPCHAVNLALGNTAGVAHLSIHPNCSTISSILDSSVDVSVAGGAISGDGSNTACEVTIANGSDFLAQQHVSSIDFVKIDVEGFECEVLLGLERVLRNSSRLVAVVECNPLSLLAGASSADQLYTILKGLTFRIFECGKFSVPHELSDRDEFLRLVDRVGSGYTNLICFKGHEQEEIISVLKL